jgi:hypothetical protein
MFLVFRVTIISKGKRKRIRLCEKVEKALCEQMKHPCFKKTSKENKIKLVWVSV